MSSLSLGPAHVSTYLQQVNGVHDRVFGDTGKGTGCHVGRQTEIRRQTLVTIKASLSIGLFLSRSVSHWLTRIHLPPRGGPFSLAQTCVRL
jgi:hypothetical protein